MIDLLLYPVCGLLHVFDEEQGSKRDTKIQVQFPGTLMEPSKILGCKEECSSSVSGWTMYIGSPVHEKDNYDDNNIDDDDDHNTYEQGDAWNRDDRRNNDDDKSDDSMASDASSGPSHQEIPWRSRKQSLDKHATCKYSSKQKLNKQKTKRDERGIKVERDEPVLKAKGAASEAPSRAKVRKSKYIDK